MKSVLISIQPKWCELIASGKKTIEVRKTAPKLETPFKCYIYCTKSKEVMFTVFLNEPEREVEYLSGKVIGEFVCARISQLNSYCLDGEDRLKDTTCLDDAELMDYVGYLDKTFYLWHISDLKIYNKPKELGEFRKHCAAAHKEYCYPIGCGYCPGAVITRPPQSFYYVEE